MQIPFLANDDRDSLMLLYLMTETESDILSFHPKIDGFFSCPNAEAESGTLSFDMHIEMAFVST
jgi:hypothetical protein